MLILAVVDTVFLLSSLLSFSLPHLSQNYAEFLWYFLVPYTLPIAQVSCRGECLVSHIYDISFMLLDVINCQRLHDDIPDN